jgi:glycerophosphoryl diester phosphodiesterase
MHHVALQVPATHAGMTLVDQSFVDAAHRLGLAVHVWTIEEETEMRRLCDLGVDGIITDVPTVLVRVLDDRSEAWRPGTNDG